MQESIIPFLADEPVAIVPGESERPALSPTKLTVLGAEATLLESLVHHRVSVEADTQLETAHRAFRDRRVEFMAVLRDSRVIGLCARGQIGFVMGSRFGFALYSHSPVETVLVADPLIVSQETPVRELLDRAMARRGDAFHEEAVLVDEDRRLLGLIPVEALAQLQSQLVAEQLDELRRQQATLLEQNLELFRANHALRQSQGLYLGLFESHTLGVALLDVEGGIHEHNRRLAELLGFGETQASLISLTAWVAEADRPGFLALLESHAANGATATTREFMLHLPGRGARLFRCSTGWIRETGQICACLDDITDQRTLERNMLRREKQTLLDTLVGGIAHELNNKLTPVQGFADLLGLEAGANARGYADYIRKSVGEAAGIVRQLLQLSKPVAPEARIVDLRVIVEETLAMLRFQLRERPCEVRTVLSATPIWVMAEAVQLKQVAINLVLNALQAMEGRTGAALTIEAHSGGTGRTAMLVVSDTGCGISAENLGRIFDPFFTTKGPERGTGLGLSICFSIIRQHGGEIAVESEPGRGARFSVTLPLEDMGNVLFSPAAASDAKPAAGTSDVPRGARVLVVEDEEVVRRLLQEMLRTQFGCRVDLASNGAEALDALVRENYTLVLSDIRMPVMSGPEFFLHLRELQPKVARRFIFLTGYPGDRQLEEEIAQWDVPIMSKPFTLTRLAEVCGPFLRIVDEGDGAMQTGDNA